MAENDPNIQVYNETSMHLPLQESDVSNLAIKIAQEENCTFRFIEIVFVDEEEIVRVNQEHLERDYVTDIITFRYDDHSDNRDIEGTLFCCAPRIYEQAREFKESKNREFMRIIIHGLLHLAGYDDQEDTQKKQMTAKENYYLALTNNKY